MPSWQWIEENKERLEELVGMNLSTTGAAPKVEDDVKELAVLLARVNYPAKIKASDNGKDAPWRQWVRYARILLDAGYQRQ